jgi:zinc/manganese transport system substrate-binding protein
VGIANRMAKLDPEHAADYRARGQRLARELEAARKGWEARLRGLKGRGMIAYHRSFAYLADWLGLRVVEHVEPKPGIPPNPRHIAHVLAVARAQHVRVILQESFYPAAATRALAERSGARVVSFHAGPDLARGQDYRSFIDDLVGQLEQVL